MSRIRLTAPAVLACVSALSAQAGGLERIAPSISPLFEDGRYLEFSATYVTPDLEGTGGAIGPPFPVAPTALNGSQGNILGTYLTLGAAYKADVTDRLSYAFIVDQPLGANTEYPTSAPAYSGSSANLTSVALSAVLAYDVTPNIKVYGGPVIQSLEADASLAFIAGYDVKADRNTGIGFMAGAAYEIPEIALRVALTYRSGIEHDLETTEFSAVTGSTSTKTDIETPQSVTLDFQTGVAENTLVFGSVRWVNWSDFDISPPTYLTLTGGRPLVAYEEDWTAYTIGIGQRFNENWAGAVSVTYEPQTVTELTSLGPVDGRMGLTIGGSYETDRMKIQGGVSYNMLGDARNVLNTDFSDGTAIGLGLKIGFKL